MMIHGLTETAYNQPKKSAVLQKVHLAFSVCFFYQSSVHSAPNTTTCSHFLLSQVRNILCPKQLRVQSFPVTIRNKTPIPKKTKVTCNRSISVPVMPQPSPGTSDNNLCLSFFQGPFPHSMFMVHQVLFQISTKDGHHCLSYYREATGSLCRPFNVFSSTWGRVGNNRNHSPR